MSANQAPIVSAQIKQRAATDRFDRKAETVAADTLKAYWDLHAALANLMVAQGPVRFPGRKRTHCRGVPSRLAGDTAAYPSRSRGAGAACGNPRTGRGVKL